MLQILGVEHLWRAPAVPAAPLLEVEHDGVQPVRPLVHDDVVQLHVGVKPGWGLADVQQSFRHLARPAELLFQGQTAASARSRRERLLQRASCVVSEHEAADADLAAEPAPLRDDVEGPRDDVRVRRHSEQHLELVVQELAVCSRGLEHEQLVAAVALHRHQRDRFVQLSLQLHAAEIAHLRPRPRSALREEVSAPHALQRGGAEPLLLDVVVRDEMDGDGVDVGADPVNHDPRAERHAVVELREASGGAARRRRRRPALEDAEHELGDRQVRELASVDEHGGVGLEDPADFWRVVCGRGDVHVDAEGAAVEGKRGGGEEAGAVHLAAVEAPGRCEDRGETVYSVLWVVRGSFPGSWAGGWRGVRRECRGEGGGWVHDRVEHIWRGLHVGI